MLQNEVNSNSFNELNFISFFPHVLSLSRSLSTFLLNIWHDSIRSEVWIRIVRIVVRSRHHFHHCLGRWHSIFPVYCILCLPIVDLHRQWRYVVAVLILVVSIDCCRWAFVQMHYRLTLRCSCRAADNAAAAAVAVVQLLYRIFSWCCHYCWRCCWNWEVVGNHCAAPSTDGTMWLVLALWLLLLRSSSSSMSFLWLWSVQNFASYPNRRFHHRSTHIRSPCQIAYQTILLPALMIMMMMMPPDSLYIECIGWIHQNGQCLWLALEMTQKLRFSTWRSRRKKCRANVQWQEKKMVWERKKKKSKQMCFSMQK